MEQFTSKVGLRYVKPTRRLGKKGVVHETEIDFVNIGFYCGGNMRGAK